MRNVPIQDLLADRIELRGGHAGSHSRGLKHQQPARGAFGPNGKPASRDWARRGHNEDLAEMERGQCDRHMARLR